MSSGMGGSERGLAGRRGSSRAADGSAGTAGRRPHRVGGVPELRVVSAEFYPDWEAVYRDNVDRIYRLMFAKVGNRPDAEDLTAEVFLAALRPLRVSASMGEVRAYLTATARTVLAGYWRRTLGREITTIAEELESAAADAALRVASPGSTDPSEVAGRMDKVLDQLPEQYRRILRMRFLEGYSVREAAAALGVSVGNAKVLQHRALRRAAQLNDEVRGE
jgi:RNA polymerase sigma-70 factor (ECF subfamily)